ncbi:hypothetical protein IV203_003932 [Nitzschia inconspicua]|uniref:Uncharacterized protein n=1 Tax=Nitzschia inconspicua TaxID=303405 RepID=A0A9K3L4E5_9STRA|nr:hypothetical protein IV203_003932 [Nitzschia inconspicua]
MRSGRVPAEGRDDNGGAVTGMFNSVVEMFESQMEKIIPNDVAEFFGSTVGSTATKTNRGERSTNHRGRQVRPKAYDKYAARERSRNMYVVPLNDSSEFGPGNRKKAGRNIKEDPLSFSLSGSSHSLSASESDFNSSVAEKNGDWQEEYRSFREGRDEPRDDVEKMDSTFDGYNRKEENPPHHQYRQQPNMVESFLSSWSTDKGLSASSEVPQEQFEKLFLDKVDAPEASKGTSNAAETAVKQQPSMIESLFSWNTEQDEEKQNGKETPENPRESVMAELKSKIHGFLGERKIPIDEVLSFQKAKNQEPEEKCMPIENLAPPCMYSLTHVRSATANPATQEAFMSEVRNWHKGHTLRKVPEDEKKQGDMTGRNRLLPTKTLQTETTTLTFVPPKEPKKKSKEPKKKSEEIILLPKVVPIAYQGEVAQTKPTRRLRKHSPQRKKKKSRSNLGKLPFLFRRRRKSIAKVTVVEDVVVANPDNRVSHSIASSKSSEKDPVALEESVPAPQSLVEQRKAQLEGFLAAYAQKVQKSRSMDAKAKEKGKSRSIDAKAKEQGSEASPVSVSETTPRTTNSGLSATGDGSCVESGFASSAVTVVSPTSWQENKSHNVVQVEEQIKPSFGRDAQSTTSSLSLPTALSVVNAASETEEDDVLTKVNERLPVSSKKLSVGDKSKRDPKKDSQLTEVLLLDKAPATKKSPPSNSKNQTSKSSKVEQRRRDKSRPERGEVPKVSKSSDGKRSSRNRSKTGASSSRRQPTTSLLGNQKHSSTYASSWSEAERRRKERKTSLSTTLF